MYRNVELEARQQDTWWDIYIKDSNLKIGFVDRGNTAFLEPK